MSHVQSCAVSGHADKVGESDFATLLRSLSDDFAGQIDDRSQVANAIAAQTLQLSEILEEWRAGQERLTSAIEQLSNKLCGAPSEVAPARPSEPCICTPCSSLACVAGRWEEAKSCAAAGGHCCADVQTTRPQPAQAMSGSDPLSAPRRLSVTVKGAHKVGAARQRLGAGSAGAPDVHCTCYVFGKPSGGFRTTSRQGSDPVWNHSGVIDDWHPGESLVFEATDGGERLGLAYLGDTWGLNMGMVFDGELILARMPDGVAGILRVRVEVAEKPPDVGNIAAGEAGSPAVGPRVGQTAPTASAATGRLESERDGSSAPAGNSVLAMPIPASDVTEIVPQYLPTSVGGKLRWLPLVQASIKVYRICSISTKSMTFEADFTVHLDWQDDSLIGCGSDLNALDWDTTFFNPCVYVHNAKEDDQWQQGYDQHPRWFPSAASSDRRLRKTMRFKGVLFMEPSDLSAFPYDLQALPIKLKTRPCRGIGNRLRSLGGSKAPREASHWLLRDSEYMVETQGYKDSPVKGYGHYCSDVCFSACSEFNVQSISGKANSAGYDTTILVDRPPKSSYTWQIIMAHVLHFAAFFSLWDQVSPDLSSRLSITLTVALTLAATNARRPQAIEDTPLVTIYDWAMHICIMNTFFISVAGSASVTLCGGYRDDVPQYLSDVYARHEELCRYSWCGSHHLDCTWLLGATLFYLVLVACLLLHLRRKRSLLANAFAELGMLDKEDSRTSPWVRDRWCDVSNTRVVPAAH